MSPSDGEPPAGGRYGFRFLVRFGHWNRVGLIKSEGGLSAPLHDEFLGLQLGNETIEMRWLPRDVEADKALTTLVVVGGTYPDADLAMVMGRLWRRRLQAAMARAGSPGSFGDRIVQKSTISIEGLEDTGYEFWNESPGPTVNRILRAIGGIYVFSLDSVPHFRPSGMKAGTVNGEFPGLLEAVANAGVSEFDDLHQRVFDLYAAAYIVDHPEARLLLLLSAAELLAPEERRSEQAAELLDEFITTTRASAALAEREVDSLANALGYLKKLGGKNAVVSMATRLYPRRYGGYKPEKLAQKCFTMRNDIVHGIEAAKWKPNDIYYHALLFGTMLGDMLSLDFIDAVPDPYPRV